MTVMQRIVKALQPLIGVPSFIIHQDNPYTITITGVHYDDNKRIDMINQNDIIVVASIDAEVGNGYRIIDITKTSHRDVIDIIVGETLRMFPIVH